MDKNFWQGLMKNEYTIPEGYSLEILTTEIFSYLGNTDPELRDDIGYMVYANWLKKGLYTQEIISEHISILMANLKAGIGENYTDSVFLRTFSILFLAEIIHNDNKNPKLEKETIDLLVEQTLSYLETEKDPRGFIKHKGWAHALAHTADLLLVLAKNHHTEAKQHLHILKGIMEKLASASDWVYVHGEDDRLSSTVINICQKNLIELDAVQGWLMSFTGRWKGAWSDEEHTRAFFNVRNFLRSLYLQVELEDDLPGKHELKNSILSAIQGLHPY